MTERNCLGPGWLVRATAVQSWQGQLMSGGRGCAAQQCLHSLSLHQWLHTAAALLCRPLGAMWTRVCRSMFSEWCRPGWLGALLSGESWQGNVAMLPFTCVRIFAHSVGCSVQQRSLSLSLYPSPFVSSRKRSVCRLLIPILSFHLCTKTLKKNIAFSNVVADVRTI